MLPSPTLLALFLGLVIAQATFISASKEEVHSDDLTSYWKIATNNQPLPEALKDLFPSETEKTQHNDQNMVPDYLRYKKYQNMIRTNYLRYKGGSPLNDVNHEVSVTLQKDPKHVNLDYFSYLGYKNDADKNNVNSEMKHDPNMIHPNYLGYKKDNPSNNDDSEVTVTLQKDPKQVNLDYFSYLGYKTKDDKNNVNSEVENDPNMVHTNYLGYKKDNPSNNDEVEVSVALQKDPKQVNLDYFSYLGYKKDNDKKKVNSEVKHDSNTMHPNYLGYKKADPSNNDDSEVSVLLSKIPNRRILIISYLGYKKDDDKNNVNSEVKHDPNLMHPYYLGYKKDNPLNNNDFEASDNFVTLQKDPKQTNLDCFSYLGYKKDDDKNNVISKLKHDPSKMHPNYLGYKKHNPSNNDDSEIPMTLQKDPKHVNLDYFSYLGYKKNNNKNNVNSEAKNDPNMMHSNYFGYKKNNPSNSDDSDVAVTLQKDPKRVNLDYFSYLGYKKNDDKSNAIFEVKHDSSNTHPNYLGYKKYNPSNNDDSKVSVSFQKDSKQVDLDYFSYLGYKKDNEKNNVNSEVNHDQNSKMSKKSLKQMNLDYFSYLGYKKGSADDNVNPEATYDRNVKMSQKYHKQVNLDYFSYLGYKKDNANDNINSKVANDQNVKMSQKNPHEAHLNYLRYKKTSLSDQVEAGKLLTFTPSDLYVGKRFLTFFPYVHTSSSSQFASAKFLPRDVADSIPFASTRLSDILKKFNIQPNSPWAETVEGTLKSCEEKEMMGETLFCATSLESLLDSVRDTIKSNYKINVISTTHLIKPSIETPQKYTLLEAPKEIKAPQKLNCHPMTYFYPVFGCHSVKDTKIYRLLLEGEDKSKVDAVGVCHMNTSDWSPSAIFLLAAGLKPGDGAVCHFMQPSHFSIYASAMASKASAI